MYQEFPDEACPRDSKPITVKSCGNDSCAPQWFTTTWGKVRFQLLNRSAWFPQYNKVDVIYFRLLTYVYKIRLKRILANLARTADLNFKLCCNCLAGLHAKLVFLFDMLHERKDNSRHHTRKRANDGRASTPRNAGKKI